MGRTNYLVEGGSGTGKTAVCNELRRLGYHAINGDRELAYQGDPETGESVEGVTGLELHDHHIWRVEQVKALIADQHDAVTFFCGDARNFAKFSEVFDGIFTLEVDVDTLNRRLDERPGDEWGGRGRQAERQLILELHRKREEVPRIGTAIDAAQPLTLVVDKILQRIETANRRAPFD